jgi:hypothetical protein
MVNAMVKEISALSMARNRAMAKNRGSYGNHLVIAGDLAEIRYAVRRTRQPINSAITTSNPLSSPH